MNDILKTINEKGSKLSRWQTYTILLIITSTLVLLPAYNITTTHMEKKVLSGNSNETIKLLREVNINLELLNKTVTNNNLDNVTYEGALTLYEKTFHTSKCKITELVMYTIVNNHIDDTIRRKVIKTTYTTSIMNMYADDYIKLANFKYNGTRLNEPLDKINPRDLIDTLLTILFNEEATHEERRNDIMVYLDNTFDSYYQESIKSI
jgi:tRNA isopentenyl-2-thiomethyl-A-37 hydroxylase MiaE